MEEFFRYGDAAVVEETGLALPTVVLLREQLLQLPHLLPKITLASNSDQMPPAACISTGIQTLVMSVPDARRLFCVLFEG